MSELNNFLSNIAQELHISQGINESGDNWKNRVVYSILGRMALASLWDVMEDEQIVSINHFKRRIEQLIYAYKTLYPEIQKNFNSDEVSEEIYNIYIQTGFLYHSPNRISPVMAFETGVNEVLFVRGAQLNRSVFMSGLGTYEKCMKQKETTHDLISMFQLQSQTLNDYWESLISRTKWELFENSIRVEYLRLNFPFTHGYWVDKPDMSGQISLLRIGKLGMQLYYLYYYKDKRCMVSILADWMVNKHEYRNISVSLLSKIHKLPAILYCMDGEIVYIQLNYLLPPAELNFFKLYSWPQSFQKFPSDFKRVMQKNIFNAFKKTLENIGYCFMEE